VLRYLQGIFMLLSSVSSSIASSAISTSAITMITTPGLPQYGAAMVSALIVILSLKEILSSSQKWNKYLNNSFNLALVPFVITFVLIVLFNVVAIIGS
jgi:hypothetical protein